MSLGKDCRLSDGSKTFHLGGNRKNTGKNEEGSVQAEREECQCISPCQPRDKLSALPITWLFSLKTIMFHSEKPLSGSNACF